MCTNKSLIFAFLEKRTQSSSNFSTMWLRFFSFWTKMSFGLLFLNMRSEKKVRVSPWNQKWTNDYVHYLRDQKTNLMTLLTVFLFVFFFFEAISKHWHLLWEIRPKSLITMQLKLFCFNVVIIRVFFSCLLFCVFIRFLFDRYSGDLNELQRSPLPASMSNLCINKNDTMNQKKTR